MCSSCSLRARVQKPQSCCRARWTAFYGQLYGLLSASTDAATLTRALEILEQLPDIDSAVQMPIREAQTLALELLMQKALGGGLEAAIMDSPAYQRYADRRRRDGLGG